MWLRMLCATVVIISLCVSIVSWAINIRIILLMHLASRTVNLSWIPHTTSKWLNVSCLAEACNMELIAMPAKLYPPLFPTPFPLIILIFVKEHCWSQAQMLQMSRLRSLQYLHSKCWGYPSSTYICANLRTYRTCSRKFRPSSRFGSSSYSLWWIGMQTQQTLYSRNSF